MKTTIIASRLKELGHQTRLSVYRLLIKAGPKGLSVGVLQKKLRIPGSTLSHHLSRLAAVGLIEQHRTGTQLHCRPKIKSLDQVVDYLQSECCSDSEDTC
jgi:DNA-binding transcriptional ArsR family regulator